MARVYYAREVGSFLKNLFRRHFLRTLEFRREFCRIGAAQAPHVRFLLWTEGREAAVYLWRKGLNYPLPLKHAGFVSLAHTPQPLSQPPWETGSQASDDGNEAVEWCSDPV